MSSSFRISPSGPSRHWISTSLIGSSLHVGVVLSLLALLPDDPDPRLASFRRTGFSLRHGD